MQSYSHCDDVQWLAVGQPGHTWVWVLQSSKVVMFIHSFDDNSGVCDFTESHLTLQVKIVIRDRPPSACQ